MNMKLLLKNATYIDWKTLEFKHTNILVEKGVHAKTKFVDNEYLPNCEILDCTGKLVTKSFAVGHHHVYSALARGMPAPKKNPTAVPTALPQASALLISAISNMS